MKLILILFICLFAFSGAFAQVGGNTPGNNNEGSGGAETASAEAFNVPYRDTITYDSSFYFDQYTATDTIAHVVDTTDQILGSYTVAQIDFGAGQVFMVPDGADLNQIYGVNSGDTLVGIHTIYYENTPYGTVVSIPTTLPEYYDDIYDNQQAIIDTASQIRADFPVDTDTQLSELEVVQIVRDTGFLESETDPIWIVDSINYATKVYADQAEQDAKDYADANDEVDDADFDPTNEIQSISIDSTGRVFTITLIGGGTITFEDTDTTIPDTDDQTLSIDGSNNLIISDGNQVSLSPYLDDTTIPDDQTLSIDSTGRVFSISIADGNTVNFEDTNTQLNESQVEAFIDGNETSFIGWDKNESDDFSGSYNDLTNVPINIDEDSTDDFDGAWSS